MILTKINKMENKLIIKLIKEEFENKYGYPSRKVTFYDDTSDLEKEIYLHKKHAGNYGIWRKIEKNGYKSLIYGEIKEISINETLIRNVDAYKNAIILDFHSSGIFVIFKFRELSEKGNLQMALKNQIWQYVKAKGELFDNDELTDEEYLIK